MDFKTKYIRTVVSAHGVKNEVYTCVMRIGLMDQ